MPQSDEFGRHEVLHVSSILCDQVDRYLLDHDQIRQNAEWQALAASAHDALFRLYQAIGADDRS